MKVYTVGYAGGDVVVLINDLMLLREAVEKFYANDPDAVSCVIQCSEINEADLEVLVSQTEPDEIRPRLDLVEK